MEEILEQKKERVILVGVCLGEPKEAEESLEELEELTRTCLLYTSDAADE